MIDGPQSGAPKEVGGVCDPATPTTATTQADTPKSTGWPRQCSADTIAQQLHRRRAASWRMAPLDCGHVDPWICDCVYRPVSDSMAEAAVAAVRLLDELGTPGLLDRKTCLAMHRIGYQRLALDVYRRSSGEHAS